MSVMLPRRGHPGGDGIGTVDIISRWWMEPLLRCLKLLFSNGGGERVGQFRFIVEEMQDDSSSQYYKIEVSEDLTNYGYELRLGKMLSRETVGE